MRISENDDFLITIDFTLNNNVEPFTVFAFLASADDDDRGFSERVEDINVDNIGPGRVVDDIRFNISGLAPDLYDVLRIDSFGDFRACDADIPVNYIIAP